VRRAADGSEETTIELMDNEFDVDPLEVVAGVPL
jgi:hypothetical protein